MADPSDIAHLLRRTEFVARQSRIDELTPLALSDAVENVIDFTANANPQVPAALQVHDNNNGYNQYVSAYNWWVDSMATRPRPFEEKMTLFWHGLFTSEWNVVGRTDHMTHQNQLYRTSCLGNLLTFTQAMALESAMILYLNNAVNYKTAPNENFARELMELYTLGVGNYTEDDVTAAARAWTGYNYDNTTNQYEYRSTKHDGDLKTFFGTTKNWDGPGIINEILHDNVDKQMITARRIARRIWEFLAYPGIEDNILTDLATLFVANNLEIKPLVRAILNRPEFYSPAAKQGLVRTPTEWAVAILAGSGLTSNAVGLLNYADGMGQTVFNPPNVAGWKSNSYWLTTSALSGRANFAKRVASVMRSNNGYNNLYAMSVSDAVDSVAKTFSVYPLADSTRTALMNDFQAERAANNNTGSVTNLLVLVMLSGEMNVG